jgi:Holliday junction resolvase-like predicted endonuclease
MQQVKTKTIHRQIDRYLKEAAREIKDLAKRQAEDRKRANEDRKRFRMYQEQFEREKAQKEIELRKMEEQLKSVGIHYGNISKNLGEIAEEFFFNGLERNLEINGFKFKTASRNMRTSDHEYDIILYGDKRIAVIEVKNKLKLKTIEELEEKIKSFQKTFKVYKKYNYYAALAGFVVPDSVRQKAEKKGIFVLTQSGEDIKILNKKGFKAKVY